MIIFSRESFSFETDSKSFDQAIFQIEQEISAQSEKLLFNSRTSRVLHHSKYTECSVLNLHGLYQSPKDQISISEKFFKVGCNVYSPLLLGHWEKDKNVFQNISALDWIDQIEKSYLLASQLGENVIIVGHSTGGLLGWILNLKTSSHVAEKKFKALIMIAPANRLNPLTKLISMIGSSLDLGRYNKSGFDPEYDAYYKPARAGRLVLDLERFADQMPRPERIVKTLIVTTDNDDTIDNQYLSDLIKYYPNDATLLHFNADENVFHDNIQRGPKDIPFGAPESWMNPHFDFLMDQIIEFSFSLLPKN